MLLSAAINAAFIPVRLRDSTGKVIEGTNAWKSGAVFGKTAEGVRHGTEFALRGQIPLMALSAGFSAGMAPRHHALSAASRTLGSTVGTVLGFATLGAVGGIFGGEIGDKVLGAPIEKAAQFVSDIGSSVNKLHFGGDFQDSAPAWTMRQAAVQQMASSNLNARRYLGAEAAFMHT